MTRCCSRSQGKLTSLGLFIALVAGAGCGDARHSLGGGVAIQNDEDPSTASHVGYCNPGASLDTIDNMEDGDGSLFLTHGRAGVWFSYNDGTNSDSTQETSQRPSAGAERFPMENFSPPRDGSSHAARTYGSGYTKWGAGIGFDLLVQQQYDASHYAGLTFWLRRSKDADSAVRLNVTDVNSSPIGGICDSSSNGCYLDFGADLVATEDWQRVSLRWDQLAQPGWTPTEKRYPGIVTSKLYGIRFQALAGSHFDFWIDDIAFMCGD